MADDFGTAKQHRDENGVRASARTFLFAESGPWKQSRELICSLSGLDPDYFAEKVRALQLTKWPSKKSSDKAN